MNILNYGGTGPDELNTWADLAEDGPFDIAMVSDHVATTPDVQALYPGAFWDPLTMLSWLAGRTRRVRIGTTVLLPALRPALLTGRMLANLDQLSGGRLTLGVGVGWAAQEFAALGVDYDRRGLAAREALSAIREFWIADKVSFQGSFTSFNEVGTLPHPLQEPHPPIWIGGNSPAAVRWAAESGDSWHPLRVASGWLKTTGLPRLREAAAVAHRNVPSLCPRISLRFINETVTDPQRPLGTGTTEQIRGDLRELAAAGAEYVIFDTDNVGPPVNRKSHEHHWETYEKLIRDVLRG